MSSLTDVMFPSRLKLECNSHSFALFSKIVDTVLFGKLKLKYLASSQPPPPFKRASATGSECFKALNVTTLINTFPKWTSLSIHRTI